MLQTRKPQLSGFNYIREYNFDKTKVGKWETSEGDDTYDYCQNTNCPNYHEHEYAFDGQVFYKKEERGD